MSETLCRKRRIQYEKCEYCRKDKKKCEPIDREWPSQRCNRCARNDFPCSANRRANGAGNRNLRAVSRSQPPLSEGQIRPIQGAYRPGKKTTIASLKKRVSDLQYTVEEMNQSFLRLNNFLMSSGLPHLNPELAKGLREIADRSVQLGKVASEASEELEVGDSEEMNEDVWPRDSLDRTTSRSVDSAGKGSSDIGWGYSQHYEHYKAAYKPSSLHTFSFPLAEFPSPILSDTQQRFRTRVSPLRPTLSLSKSNSKGSPDGPYTYSFQEETFARRLQRAALERIYHLILHAHYSPATFAQIFKFPLLYSSREQLLAQFRDALRRGTNEDLEMHWPPFIHFGGAGTLYPEYSADGEWFDANDVAGYLEEKGIQIDPQASFSEVQMGMEDQWLPSESVMEFDAFTAVSSFADPNTTAVIDAIPVTITGSRSGSSNVSYCPQTPLLNNPHGDGYASLTDVPGDTFDAPIMDLDGCWSSEGANMLNQFETPLASLNPLDFGIAARGPNFPSQGVNIPLAPYIAVSRRNNRQPGKKTKIIDVSKLIDEITKDSVCLGRAPGFRRNDIDNAFQASLVNIY